MSNPPETLRVVIPLNIRKRNGRPKILTPSEMTAPQDRTQAPHILRTLGRSLGWRRRLECGSASTVQDIAETEHLSLSYVSRYLRLAYLSPEVLEAIILERRPIAIRVIDLVRVASTPWVEQVEVVFGE